VQPENVTPHIKGLLLALLGVTILSFDSLLVRLINADAWDLLFWRGALLSLTLIPVQLASRPRHPGPRAYLEPMTYIGGAAFAASMIFFVLALNNTEVASALVITNTAPFFAAIIALVFLRETLQRHTAVAIAVSTAGIWIIFEYEPSAGAVKGDVLALIGAVGMAGYLVVMRAAKGVNGASYLIAAGIFTAVAALANGANPAALQGESILFMVLLGCIVVPGSSLCIARAPRYLPAAQTGLVLLLEILLGPLFVYLFLGERPSGNDISGGALVLLTLIAHTLWEVRYTGRKAP
jgi:drug/metabolite transporter (DMT)-like permease